MNFGYAIQKTITKHFRCFFGLSLLTLTCYRPAASVQPVEDVFSSVAPDKAGEVAGFVVDAHDQQTLAGAQIEVLDHKQTAPTVSDSQGYYQFNAPLGRVYSKFAAKRLFTLSILSALSGGAKQVEKFVTATQFLVKVSKPGYKTYQGSMVFEEADAGAFRVQLQGIALARANTAFASYSSPNYALGTFGKSQNFTLSSVIPEPGSLLKFGFTVSRLPLSLKMQAIKKPNYYFKASNGAKYFISLGKEISLKSETTLDQGVFETQWKVPEKVQAGLCELRIGSNVQYFAVQAPDAIKSKVVALLTQLNNTAPEPTFSQKLGVIDQMLAIWPESAPTVNYYRSTLLFYSHRNAEALQSLENSNAKKKDVLFKLLQPSPNGTVTAKKIVAKQDDLALSQELTRQKKYDESLVHLRNAVKNEISVVGPAHQLLANNLAHLQRFDEAEPLLRAMMSSPEASKLKNFWCFHNYAVILMRADKIEEALPFFAKAVFFARDALNTVSDNSSFIPYASSLFRLYDKPLVRASVGYSSSEAQADSHIVKYREVFKQPVELWLQSTVVANALIQIGLPKQGLALLRLLLPKHGQETEVLLSVTKAQIADGRLADAQKTLKKLQVSNLNNPQVQMLEEFLSATKVSKVAS